MNSSQSNHPYTISLKPLDVRSNSLFTLTAGWSDASPRSQVRVDNICHSFTGKMGSVWKKKHLAFGTRQSAPREDWPSINHVYTVGLMWTESIWETVSLQLTWQHTGVELCSLSFFAFELHLCIMKFVLCSSALVFFSCFTIKLERNPRAIVGQNPSENSICWTKKQFSFNIKL